MASGTNVGTAYVQIIPSTEGISGNISSLLGDEMKGAGEQGGEGFGKSMFGALLKSNFVTGIASTLFDGVQKGAQMAVGFIKDIVTDYAEFQQLEGGVKKLYGNMGLDVQGYADAVGKSVDEVKGEWQNLENAQNLVMNNARQAYKTAGMDMNTYMDTATSFSASLITSLNGDTIAAAQQTDVAMQAISDNWNTFGGDLNNITNAYQGFAKQNYTMLDNLKLGYGGTKEEMQRLIEDANAWAEANGEAANLSIDSFSDVVTAIELIQEKQHIAGTTAREATETVSGSIGMLKAAWENLKIGLGDPEADISQLVSAVVDAAEVALDNLLPVIGQALDGIGELITQLAPVIEEKAPSLIEKLTPAITSGIESLVKIGAAALTDLAPVLLDAAGQLIQALLQAFAEQHPVAAKVLQGIFNPAGAIADATQANAEAATQNAQLINDAYAQKGEERREKAKGIWQGIFSDQAEQGQLMYENAISSTTNIGTAMSGAFGNLANTVSDRSSFMSSTFNENLSGMSSDASTNLNGIQGVVAEKLGNANMEALKKSANIKTSIGDSWKNIVSDTTSKFGNANRAAVNAMEKMRSGMSTKTKAISANIKDVFSKATSMMTSPFDSAWGTISGTVSKLKNAFNFSWSLPKFKLPHLSVSGGSAPWGIGGKGSLPKFSVSWYAKAYDTPYLFNTPTIVPAMGFGDGMGTEIVYGKDSLMQDIKSAVNESKSEGGDIIINLHYNAGDDANEMVRDIARVARRYKMAGAI